MPIIEIVKAAYKGYSVGYLNSKVVFVPFSDTGEIVDVEIVQEKKSFVLAKLVRILQQSLFRRTPFCKYFGECGGCHYQHLKYKRSLEIKAEVLKSIIKRISKINIERIGAISSKQTFYRHRVRFQTQNSKLGYYKLGSKDFLEVDFCPILSKKINQYIKQCNNCKSLITIDDFGKISTGFKDMLKIDFSFIKEGLSISYKMGNFTQVNPYANRELVNLILDLVENEDVLEAYCGIGNFSIPLAIKGHNLSCFDIDKNAIDTLSQNAKRLNLKIKANVYNLDKSFTYNRLFGTLLLDPPRNGAKKLMEFINRKQPNQVIYVSCEPPTLSRDISLLKNYNLEKIFLVDMFPNTYHFETVAVLKHNK